MGPAEKKYQILLVIGFVVTGVTIYYVYNWMIDPLGTIFGLRKIWKIGIAAFGFFAGFGLWCLMINMFGFYEQANSLLNKQVDNCSHKDSVEEDH